jgi:putative transposase
MARLPRLVVPGLAHHVVQRSHSGRPPFADDADRREYLDALEEATRARGVAVLAYALLDDEVHLLLVPPDPGALAAAMQAIGRRYVAAFRRRHGGSGTLWDGRFRAGVVEPGPRTLDVLRLIDTLPVRRGLAASPEAAVWSSAPHRLGRVRDRRLAEPAEVWALGNTPFEREAAYGRLLARGLDAALEQRLEHAARHGWAVGSEAFLAGLAQSAGRAVRPRGRGRPRRSAGRAAPAG